MMVARTARNASIHTAIGNGKRFSFLLWQPHQLRFTFAGGTLKGDSKVARKLRTRARF
jgi:hypothetical protein